MNVTTTLVRRIHLDMTEEEAAWLHGVMQNPLHNTPDSMEDPQDARMRQLFFQATTFRD